MMELNISRYITKNITETKKEIYNTLKRAGSINYSYRNFAKKLQEDNLTAKELMHIAILYDLKLDPIMELARRFSNSKLKIDEKKEEISMTNIQNLLENLIKLDLINKNILNTFQSYTKKRENKKEEYVTVIWSNVNDNRILIYSDNQMKKGKIIHYSNFVSILLEGESLVWRDFVNNQSKLINNTLISILEKEHKELNSLGLIPKVYYEFDIN